MACFKGYVDPINALRVTSDAFTEHEFGNGQNLIEVSQHLVRILTWFSRSATRNPTNLQCVMYAVLL